MKKDDKTLIKLSLETRTTSLFPLRVPFSQIICPGRLFLSVGTILTATKLNLYATNLNLKQSLKLIFFLNFPLILTAIVLYARDAI
jgi:hypothetical protein